MSYHHITTFERGCIEALHKIGFSTREIAKSLGRHHSAIARELRRNKHEKGYSCNTAQKNYHSRRQLSKPKGKFDPHIAKQIEDKLNATWSPEEIANTITAGKVSFKTIYIWLYQGKLSKGNLQVLRQKGKRRKPSKQGTFVHGTSISQRPKEVKNRETFGHWELDTIVSSRGKSKGCFATFVERKTRFYAAIKLTDRTADSMEGAIKKLYYALPRGAIKTATTDRGKEFACYDRIEKQLGVNVYFADPYSSWQRGSNENSNGLLGEFYPKKTNLALVDPKELFRTLCLINERPKKCLGWKTPIQLFLHELSHLS